MSRMGFLAALASLVVAAPARAAEPPAGVIFDGAVTVTFTLDGAPVADAAIVIEAWSVEGGSGPLQVATGTTDASGTAVVTGVARHEEGATEIVLQASGHTAEPNECGGELTTDGFAQAPAAPTVTLELVGFRSSSCHTPIFRVEGSVVTTDGAPVEIRDAAAMVTYPGGSTDHPSFDLPAGGRFSIIVSGWTTEGSAVVEFEAVGGERIVALDGTACDQRVVDEAETSWELETPTAPALVAIVAVPVLVGEVCGNDGTPAPAAAPTLPATDEAPSTVVAQPEIARIALYVEAMLIAGVVMVAWFVGRRISRRGS